MQQLPRISETLESAMEYFAPMAKSIHPDMQPSQYASEVMHLTKEWLNLEFGKAHLEFLKKHDIKIF